MRLILCSTAKSKLNTLAVSWEENPLLSYPMMLNSSATGGLKGSCGSIFW